MSWLNHIHNNIESLAVAFMAGLSVFIVKMFFNDRQRLKAVEVGHKELKHNTELEMARLETAITTVNDNLSRCTASVAKDVGELGGILKVVSENQAEVSRKLDRLIERREEDRTTDDNEGK